MQITTIGLDLAKHWFQVHGVDASGRVVVRRKLWRSGVIAYFRSLEPCLVGMEACATAHYWARELTALGHTVKLMPPAYVKAYVKRNKNDAADAAAICEAVTRPSMRFVPVKDTEQQSVLMLHRARSLLIRQRTMLVNALRAHMAEFGIVAPKGLRHVGILTKIIAHQQERLPELAHSILQTIVDQLNGTGQDPGDRGAPGQVAPAEPGQSFAGDRAGCWHHGRERDCRDGCRSFPVPIRPRVCGLAGDDAAAELQRR
jgi:transposase